MRRYLLRRIARRMVGESREPIRSALDHHEPILSAEREYLAVDHIYGAIVAVFGVLTVATLIIVYTGALE
jgi:hypothetical protein